MWNKDKGKVTKNKEEPLAHTTTVAEKNILQRTADSPARKTIKNKAFRTKEKSLNKLQKAMQAALNWL